MRLKIVFCIVLMLAATVDTASAQRKRKGSKKQQSTEVVYEEIDNFDFVYASDNKSSDFSFNFVNDLLDRAASLIGARYRSGSKGPHAFDCSGFTSYVYAQDNISIGCSSRDQYARNIPVKRSEMQPGDLVFFTSPASGRGVGHVGIIVDFDPISDTFSFIHASTKYGVIVSRSTDGYYSRRYVGVRRVAR